MREWASNDVTESGVRCDSATKARDFADGMAGRFSLEQFDFFRDVVETTMDMHLLPGGVEDALAFAEKVVSELGRAEFNRIADTFIGEGKAFGPGGERLFHRKKGV